MSFVIKCYLPGLLSNGAHKSLEMVFSVKALNEFFFSFFLNFFFGYDQLAPSFCFSHMGTPAALAYEHMTISQGRTASHRLSSFEMQLKGYALPSHNSLH